MANFDKYGWYSSAEEDAEIADKYFDDFVETGSDEYFKRSVMLSLAAIGKALIDIRDELRKEEHHGEN